MRRLILNKLRNAEGKNTFRMMYDPNDVLGVVNGKVLLKSAGYLPKTRLTVGTELKDEELIYIDLDKIDYSKLPKMTCMNPLLAMYVVAEFSITDKTTYEKGYLTIDKTNHKPYIGFETASKSGVIMRAIDAGGFQTNKYGTYAMFNSSCGTDTLTALYVDLYHIEKMNKIIPGVQLKSTTKIYVDTRQFEQDTALFNTNSYIVGWDAVNKQAVCGTTILETTLDGFVAIFRIPTDEQVIYASELCYYEEA